MMETLELHKNPTPAQDEGKPRPSMVGAVPPGEDEAPLAGTLGWRGWTGLFRQVLRFGLVGGLNTLVDLLILNSLLLLFPTNNTPMLLAYNSLAYSIGAVNSFLLNKYWTFGQRQRTTRKEVVRFVLTTLCGIGWSSIILWLASNLLHPFLVNTTIWANASKVLAIGGTALISYLGMRLWVFVSKGQQEQTTAPVSDEHRSLPAVQAKDALTKIRGDQAKPSMVGTTARANTFQSRRFASQTKPLRMTKRDRLFFEMY